MSLFKHAPTSADGPVGFETVLLEEHQSIQKRIGRKGKKVATCPPSEPPKPSMVNSRMPGSAPGANAGGSATLVTPKSTSSNANPAKKDDGTKDGDPVFDTVGLGLSGGGIRSAAVCLGGVQALQAAGVFDRIDYLSTVSGGGYLGASLTAALTEEALKNPNATKLPFPLESQIAKDEVAAVQHIRDYSNYLIPHGFWDIFTSVAIYLRGLAANAILVLPWILFGAALSAWSTPTRNSLSTGNLLGQTLPPFMQYEFFTLTRWFGSAFVLCLAVWAVGKSFQRKLARPEIPGFFSTVLGRAVIALAAIAFCELQPWITAAVFEAYSKDVNSEPHVAKAILATIVGAVKFLTPLAVAVGVWGNRIGSFIKQVGDTDRFSAQAIALAGKLAMFLSAFVVPLILWLLYLQLSVWAISVNEQAPSVSEPFWRESYLAPEWMKALTDQIATWTCTPHFQGSGLAPLWLKEFGTWLAASGCSSGIAPPLVILYGALWAVLLILSFFLAPNANSLHRLYRDRLSKAFLVCPRKGAEFQEPIATIDKLKLHELTERHAPYHLINAALNVQASKYVNRRGRNADFFLFSRNHSGSVSTGYVRSEHLSKRAPDVDVATAMAISGAAASSNMGSSTIRQWTLSLALLNVRLGYWMRNPRYIYGTGRFWQWLHEVFNLYFFYEMFGLLNERRAFINLSDGGHVENLGLYELLRRRCRTIIIIDAEADPKMNFGSFIALQRYARIDLGTRIELPWNRIRKMTLSTAEAIRTNGGTPAEILDRKGPHCAVGKIAYPSGTGYMLYVKSSLSGDESDYVMDYKRRHANFPHETTGDQFFTEEQFEVYRALGFHAVYGFFTGRDDVAELETGLAATFRHSLSD